MASLTSLRRSVRLLNVPSRASTFADNSRNLLRSRFAFAINCCARKSIYAGIQRRSRSNKEIRARNESALSSSQGRCPEKAKEAGQEACYLPQNQTLRQGLERSFRFPRPCLRVVWRITLAREFAVGETLAEHLTHAKLKTLAIVHVLAVVETEHLLVKVAVEMIRFHTHIRAMQPALYETPEVFQRVRVYAAMHVLNRMIYNSVLIVLVKPDVRFKRIRVDGSASLDLFTNERLHIVLATPRDDLCADLPATLHKSDNDCLVVVYAASELRTAVLVHVAGLPADECLIHFHFAVWPATELLPKEVILQCQPNPLQHEPRGLLGDPQSAVNLHAADTVLAIAEHPKSGHPLIHAERGILENGADLDGELLVAATAKPQPPCLDEVVLGGVAPWTAHLARRPAQFDRVVEGTLRIGEVNDGVLQCLWRLHKNNIRQFFACVKYIFAQYCTYNNICIQAKLVLPVGVRTGNCGFGPSGERKVCGSRLLPVG